MGADGGLVLSVYCWDPIGVRLGNEPGGYTLSLVDQRQGMEAVTPAWLGVDAGRLEEALAGVAARLFSAWMAVEPEALDIQTRPDRAFARIQLKPGASPRHLTVERLKPPADRAREELNAVLVELGATLPPACATLAEALAHARENAAFGTDLQRFLAEQPQLYLWTSAGALHTVAHPKHLERGHALLFTDQELGRRAISRWRLRDRLEPLRPEQAFARLLGEMAGARLAGVMLDSPPDDPRPLVLDRHWVAAALATARLRVWSERDTWWVIGDPPLGMIVPYAPHRQAVYAFTTEDAALTYARFTGRPDDWVRAWSRTQLLRRCLQPNHLGLAVDPVQTTVALEGAELVRLSACSAAAAAL